MPLSAYSCVYCIFSFILLCSTFLFFSFHFLQLPVTFFISSSFTIFVIHSIILTFLSFTFCPSVSLVLSLLVTVSLFICLFVCLFVLLPGHLINAEDLCFGNDNGSVYKEKHGRINNCLFDTEQ